ncbi:MAG: formyltransferase, partial [Acidobacteria bacterium]
MRGRAPRRTPVSHAPRVLLFGYHDIGAAGLRVLLEQGARVVGVVTHADDPGEAIWFASVAAAARAAGLPVFLPVRPSDPAFLAEAERLAPDLIVSCYYRRLLPPALLALPRLGACNLHGSLLPKYRGRAPLNWVLVNGETQTGV